MAIMDSCSFQDLSTRLLRGLALRVILGLYIGVMEKKMETTINRFRVILGLYWDDGKENGNYYSILGV